jgi:hypothetical protein
MLHDRERSASCLARVAQKLSQRLDLVPQPPILNREKKGSRRFFRQHSVVPELKVKSWSVVADSCCLRVSYSPRGRAYATKYLPKNVICGVFWCLANLGRRKNILSIRLRHRS